MPRRSRLPALLTAALVLLTGAAPASAAPRAISGTLQAVPAEGGGEATTFLLDAGRRTHLLTSRQPAALVGRRVTVRDGDRRRRGIQGRVRAAVQARAAAGVVPTWRARPRKVAVIRVVWDGALDDPAPPATVDAVAHSAANANDAFFRAQTGGALRLKGALDDSVDVLPTADGLPGGAPAEPLVLPRPSGCSDADVVYGLVNAVKPKFPEATLAQYDHLSIAFPRLEACGWDGLGTIGNPQLADFSQQWTWVNGVFTSPYARWVLAHELGHNLGAGHASTVTCRDGGLLVQISGSCQLKNTYGDPFDVMGGQGLPPDSYRLMSAWNRVQTGQLTTAALTTAATTGGVYELTDANAPGSSGTRTLLVPRGTTGDFFALEHRGPLEPFDTWAPGTGPGGGVLVRLVPGIGGAGADTMLLDMTPATPASTDAALPAGQSFTDPVSGLTISALAAGDGGARVHVTSPPQPQAPAAPTSPGAGATGGATGAAPPAPSLKLPVLRMSSPKLRAGYAKLPRSRRITLSAPGATQITAKGTGRRAITVTSGTLRLRLTAKQRKRAVVRVTATGNAPAATVHLTLRVRRGAITIAAR